MADHKPLSVLISMGTAILVEKCPTTPAKMENIAYVPYASAINIRCMLWFVLN